MSKKKIGVLALQGAFAEHIRVFTALGCECTELRQKADLTDDLDALVLPGGESTVQGKLLRELGMFEPLQRKIKDGLPVLATCAGLILLAWELDNDPLTHFATLPVTVRRNAFGRQLASFIERIDFTGIGPFPMTFIRAPYITECKDGAVQVLASVKGHPVAVRWQSQLALAFHPELGGDKRIHEYFLQMC